MQSISVFLDKTKVINLRLKNDDVSRTKWDLSRDSYIF